jgi:hypothetical protein
VKVTPEDGGFRIAVDLDAPLPKELVGKAGFNLDFLPTAYFGKTYLMGDQPGLFPRNPNGPMATDGSGDPQPMASGAQECDPVAGRSPIRVSPSPPTRRSPCMTHATARRTAGSSCAP